MLFPVLRVEEGEESGSQFTLVKCIGVLLDRSSIGVGSISTTMRSGSGEHHRSCEDDRAEIGYNDHGFWSSMQHQSEIARSPI